MMNDKVLSSIFPKKANDCFEIRYRSDTSIAKRVESSQSIYFILFY